MKQIVFLATAWGTKYGGINSFNLDLCKAVADQLQQGNEYQVVCVVLNADQEAIKNAECDHVRLISLDVDKQDFDINYADKIVRLLGDEHSCTQVAWWIGHDVFSGPIALELRNIYNAYSSKAALIHHMDYRAYKSFELKGQDDPQEFQRKSQAFKTKLRRQGEIFRDADAVFAVGPSLQKSAQSLRKKPVTSLIPGLIEDVEGAAMPQGFSIITLGRLDSENDVIKQLTLSADALGKMYTDYKSLKDYAERPQLWVYGISEDPNEFQKLSTIVEKSAHARISTNAFPYNENRQEVWSNMKECSVCLMPSLYEGFGLVGWEAIGLEVPLILSIHTGLFRFLNDLGLNRFQSIDITGIVEQDTEPLAKLIAKVYLGPRTYKDMAVDLKKFLLKEEYTWKRTAHDFLKALGIEHEKISLFVRNPEATSKAERVDKCPAFLSNSKILPPSSTGIFTEQDLERQAVQWLDKHKEILEDQAVEYVLAEYPVLSEPGNYLDSVDKKEQFKQSIHERLEWLLAFLENNVDIDEKALEILRKKEMRCPPAVYYCAVYYLHEKILSKQKTKEIFPLVAETLLRYIRCLLEEYRSSERT